jgi:transposase-like protein
MPAPAAALREGWKVVEVARRLLVCRQSVHNWIARSQQGGLTAEPRRIECQLARAGVGAVPSRSGIYRCLKRHGLIDLRRRRKRREDFGRWERDRLMQLWQIDVMGGVMLEDGAELKVVTGLDPDNRTTGTFSTRPSAGR